MAYIVASETAFPGEAVASYDQPIPDGHQSGDLLLAIVSQDGGGTTIEASGWTQIGTQAAVQSQRTTAFYKFATSSAEADFSATGATDEWIVNISVIRGADPITPINAEVRTDSANSTSSSLASGTVATTEDNCLVIYACGFDSIFKLIPQNPSDLVMIGRETDFVGITQVVGYTNQITAGTTPDITFLSEVASEGGNALVIAIQDDDPTNALLSPTATNTYTVLKRYGGITTAASNVAAFIRHESVTWDAASDLAATAIAGLDLLDILITEVTFQDALRPWGSMSGLSTSGSAVDSTGRWVGASHAVASTDMSNKIFSVEFMLSSVATARFGAEGIAVVFEDSGGNWVAHRLTKRAGLLAAVSYTFHVDLEGATALDSSGTIDWSDITRVGYLYHRRTTSTSVVALRVKNALLHDKLVMVDGNVNDPCSPAKFQQILDGWGPVGLGSVQGGGQGLLRAGVQYGNGSRKSYTSTSATSCELPLRANSSLLRRFWQVPDNSASAALRINASANDVVNLSASVMATNVEQDWTIDDSSSTSAVYNFTGASIVGWNVTHNRAGITISGATIQGCDITLNGGSLGACNIVASKSPLSTNDPSKIADCAFKSAGSGHAITITVAGTYNFYGNTFDGYGADSTTDAAIYNNSGGAVTLTLEAGDVTPTVLNGASASTTIDVPEATYTIEFPNISGGSRYQIYNITEDVEMANDLAGSTGISEVFIKDEDYTAGDVGRYRITYQSGTSAKKEIEGTFTFGTETTVNSLPVSQTDDAPYNAYGVDGSGITEFSWDSGNIEIDINDSTNTTAAQRLAAWYSYFITTATGIDEAFGAVVWENVNSIKIAAAVVDLKIDNVKSSPLLITGGRIYRDDGATIIASTSNSVQIDYDPVYVVEVDSGGGGGGATAEEVWEYATRTLTTTIPTASENATAVRSELTTELGRIDVATSTRLATGGYTAPDNASITSILEDTATTIPAQIAALNDFNPATDKVTVEAIDNNVITSSVIATNALNNSAFTTGYFNAINSEVDTALADYDAPTKAELDTAESNIIAAIPDVANIDIDGTYTLQESLRLHNAALAGKTSISGSLFTFRDIADTKDVITATVSGGARTDVTVDAT